MVAFNKGFNLIFNLFDEERDTEDEEQGNKEDSEREREDVNGANEANSSYWLMCLIKNYSDFTNTEWQKVWDVNIIEFFQTVSFAREYERRKADEIRKLYNKH